MRVRPLVTIEKGTDEVVEVLSDVLGSLPRIGALESQLTSTLSFRSSSTTHSAVRLRKVMSTVSSLMSCLASWTAITSRSSHMGKLALEKRTPCSAKATRPKNNTL